jgi:hypothetical protein
MLGPPFRFRMRLRTYTCGKEMRTNPDGSTPRRRAVQPRGLRGSEESRVRRAAGVVLKV